MKRRALAVAAALAAMFGAVQLVRPQLALPATDASRSLAAQVGPTSELAGVLNRSCNGCHSNAMEARWYTRVAPLSWVMARGASLGRASVNYSEWASYTPAQQQALLLASCATATSGKMPTPGYSVLRREAKLTRGDIAVICAAASAQRP